jgi:hypothetical protein
MTTNKSKVHCRRHTKEIGGAYKMFVVKPEGKTPLGRPRGKWEDNIEVDI